MVRLVSFAAMVSLVGFNLQPTTADSNGFRGAKRVDCKMSDWSPFEACSATGYKTQTRMVVVQPSAGGSPCPSTVSTASCSKKECWMGPWSDWVCDSSTGMKQRSRAIAPGGVQDTKKCPAKVQQAVCDPIPCVINTLEEDAANPWGECTFKRGQWTKTKALGVKTPAQYGGLCFEPTHPMRKVTAPCAPVNCVVTPVELDTGAWSECKETSPSVWTKTKTLSIQTPALYGGTPCSDASRVATAPCAVDCQWSTTDFESDWTSCDDSGHKYRPYKIVQQPTPGGKQCPTLLERSKTEECVNCVEGAWTEPSVCFQNAAGSWITIANRTVTTPSANGGRPCGELTRTETCVPGPYCDPLTCGQDVAKYCDPLVDATAKASCASAMAKTKGVIGGAGWVGGTYVSATTIWECIAKCAATEGCQALNHWTGSTSCYLQLYPGYTPFYWSGTMAAEMIAPLAAKPPNRE